MIKDIIIGILLVAVAGLGGLYENTKYKLENSDIDLDKYKVALHKADSSVTKITEDRNNAYYILDSLIYEYRIKLTNSNKKAESMEAKYNDLINNLTGVSNDSIAKYIVENFAGSTYKLQKINDTLFIAFEDTTARDIVLHHLECEKQSELLKLAKNDISSKDSIIKLQSKKIAVADTSYDNLKTKYLELSNEMEECSNVIVELDGELDRQRKFKLVGFITSGGLFVLLLIAL